VTSDTVRGLTNGTAYSFTIAAVNSVGTGPNSARSNSVTPKATSVTVLKLSVKKVTYGDEQVESISARVSPQHSGGTVTGTVTIKASTTTLCVIKLKSAKGSCSLSVKKLVAGTYHLVATYGGSANYKGSTSTKETLVVAK
jgi:titin